MLIAGLLSIWYCFNGAHLLQMVGDSVQQRQVFLRKGRCAAETGPCQLIDVYPPCFSLTKKPGLELWPGLDLKTCLFFFCVCVCVQERENAMWRGHFLSWVICSWNRTFASIRKVQLSLTTTGLQTAGAAEETQAHTE